MQYTTVQKTAEKWYHRLPFPAAFEPLFRNLLKETEPLSCCLFEDYDLTSNRQESKKNLIMFLYFCEELSQRYQAAGIPEQILMDTLKDLPEKAKRHYGTTGSLGLSGIRWVAPMMRMEQFRLGRLVYCMSTAPMDIPEKEISAGDPVVDIHVPAGSRLTPEDCKASFDRAEAFFATYFPDYPFSWYTCFSWLLDDTLEKFLKPESNILRFARLFEPVFSRKEDSILHFVFKYGITSREELRS